MKPALGLKLLLATALIGAAVSVQASPIPYAVGAGLTVSARQGVEGVDLLAMVEGGLARLGPDLWSSAAGSGTRKDVAIDSPSVVAEPTTLLLLGSGLLTVAFTRRRLMRRS